MTNYFSLDYNDKGRWASYWHQIKEVLEFNPKKVLVIGKGDGLVPMYLKNFGLDITTLDIDEALSPDIKASVLNIPVGDGSFDVVLCAEVLEHLPFGDFHRALAEIERVAKFGAIISLPHFGPAVRFLLKLPFLSEIKFLLKLPYPLAHIFKVEHYWEIGKKNYPLKLIKSEIAKAGFSIKKDYIAFIQWQDYFGF